jgi:hypothetical protein
VRKITPKNDFNATIERSSQKVFRTHREEVSLVHGPEEDDSHQSKVGSKHNTSGKDFIELPAVGQGRWLNSVLRDSHDSTCKYTYHMRNDACMSMILLGK